MESSLFRQASKVIQVVKASLQILQQKAWLCYMVLRPHSLDNFGYQPPTI